ncbi:MAG: hypothetical protein PVF83_01005 [Anaerolineales bacterium]
MTLRDVEWVAERTNVGDAVGFWGYALLFALLESIIAWVFLLLLNFLLTKQWERQIRMAVLGSIVFIVAIWAVLGQMYFLVGRGTPEYFLKFAIGTGHPLWVLYGIALTSITGSVIFPVVLLTRYPDIREKLLAAFDRIAVLSGLYLFLDFIGIAIVVARNLF